MCVCPALSGLQSHSFRRLFQHDHENVLKSCHLNKNDSKTWTNNVFHHTVRLCKTEPLRVEHWVAPLIGIRCIEADKNIQSMAASQKGRIIDTLPASSETGRLSVPGCVNIITRALVSCQVISSRELIRRTAGRLGVADLLHMSGVKIYDVLCPAKPLGLTSNSANNAYITMSQ